jgi:hypothetical protein
MNDHSTKTLRGHYNASKRIFGSFDPKYHDEIITKLNLQTREPELQNQKIQGEVLHNQKRREYF